VEADPHRALELRERLAEIRRLPARQQRLVMLQGFGYEYEEIAAATGDSRRTVMRQLTRARQRLAVLGEQERERDPPPRG
jgi:DNA-directed RNA polymerase specialized sigma24 family protein